MLHCQAVAYEKALALPPPPPPPPPPVAMPTFSSGGSVSPLSSAEAECVDDHVAELSTSAAAFCLASSSPVSLYVVKCNNIDICWFSCVSKKEQRYYACTCVAENFEIKTISSWVPYWWYLKLTIKPAINIVGGLITVYTSPFLSSYLATLHDMWHEVLVWPSLQPTSQPCIC